MSFWKSALALLVLSLCARGADAFTPESGLWWNPAEDGRGYTIEIQDNVLVILVYGYDNDRSSAFFIGAGPMVGNSSWSGTLDGFNNGQCLTCNYQGRPITLTGAGGPASIVFDTETRGRLTLGGRVIPIERQNFALGNVLEQMQGEWQVVFDLSTRPGGNPPFASFPFFGDVLIINTVNTALNPDQFLGCRPESSVIGRCTASASANHDLAGFFDSTRNEHVIVVTDVAGSATTTQYLTYFVKSGLSQFDGVLQFRVGANPESPVRFFPVRGFRSASKRYVQTGVGPSSVDPTAKSTSNPQPGLLESLGGLDQLPQGLSAAEVKSEYGIDVEALEPRVQELIQSMR